MFFSDKLKQKLNRIHDCSLSVIEAPAGYGKTTAVHYALDRLSSRVFWYTAVESVSENSFNWFIRQISTEDENAANQLASLGYLNRSNAREAGRIIEDIHVDIPMVLVFDNFQFEAEKWQPQVMDALSKCSGALRTVFIAQDFGRLREVLNNLGDSICYIKSKDLTLSVDDIEQYAREQSIELSRKQIREIEQNTDGWAAGVAIFLESSDTLPESGSISGNMNELLYELFWKKLSEGQQEALLRLCLFDRLSPGMIQELLPKGYATEQNVKYLYGKTPLVRFNEARKEFYPHEILLKFLRGLLFEQDQTFISGVCSNAGNVYREKGMTKAALNCFFKAGDYENILKLKLVCLITESFDGVSYTAVAQEVLSNCPEDIQKKYPLSLLRLCYALFAGCKFTEFDHQMKRIKMIIEDLSDRQWMGEWYLVNALSFFPDLDKMKEMYLKAEEYLYRDSEVFIKEEPFMFGCASMWYLFFSEPGAMLETADKLDEVMRIYNSLTNGHGSGAAEIYRGECYSVQGRFDESDIQAYQAAFLAEQAGNSTAVYGVALLLGINAIYTSSIPGLKKAIDYLETKAQGFAFLKGTMLNDYMAETVRGYLLGLMMETGRSPLWTQGDADSLSDLTFTNFMIKTCRITDMLLKKEYRKAIASVEASLRLDRRLITTSTRNFMYCGLALSYMAIGRLHKAAEYLDRSLELAGQDKNYTFLACFRKYFQILFIMPPIAARHSKTIREIKMLKINYTRADETHIFAMLDEVPEFKEELTDREREIAELAAKGYRNSEIAEQLFISENTVKHHLKSAFQKLNIDRRSMLIDMLR